MRLAERHLAALALVACLFLPYYVEIPRDEYLLLVIAGGPVPIWSPLAAAVTAIFLVARPRYGFMPVIQWLAAWLVGLGLLVYGGALASVPPWPWVVAFLVGAWAASVARRAPRQQEARTDVSVFD